MIVSYDGNALGSFNSDTGRTIAAIFTVFASNGDQAVNPWDDLDSIQAIAYGRSGNIGGNAGKRHRLMSQTNVGNEFTPAWLAVTLYVSY